MKILKLDKSLLDIKTRDGGKFIYEYPGLNEMYGREKEHLVLKITSHPLVSMGRCWLSPAYPYVNDAFENTIIQNIAAWHGFAPRVYDLLAVEEPSGVQYLAQVTEFVQEDESVDKDVRNEEIVEFLRSKRIKFREMGPRNMVADKLVDFDGFVLPEDYLEKLKIRAKEVGCFNASHMPAYQTIPQLLIEGTRHSAERSKLYALSLLGLNGKTVLDVGCNLGFFCLEAALWGAKRVVGVERADVAEIAFEITNYLCHFNTDILGVNLMNGKPYVKVKEKCRLDEFDWVFYLSMSRHFGFPAELPQMCKESMLFEGHHADTEEQHWEVLSKYFNTVDYSGIIESAGRRPYFVCHKN